MHKAALSDPKKKAAVSVKISHPISFHKQSGVIIHVRVIIFLMMLTGHWGS